MARYNWCQGPVLGHGPAVEKHCPMERNACFQSIFTHRSVPREKNVSWFSQSPPSCSYGERCSISRANGLITHLYLSESPVKGVRPWNRRKTYGHHPLSHTCTESLHTLGYRVSPPHLLPPPGVTPGMDPHNPEVWTRGWIYGRLRPLTEQQTEPTIWNMWWFPSREVVRNVIKSIMIIIIIIPLVLFSRGIIPNKLKESLKLLNLLPGLYIIMQKAVIFDTWGFGQKSKEVLSQRDHTLLRMS